MSWLQSANRFLTMLQQIQYICRLTSSHQACCPPSWNINWSGTAISKLFLNRQINMEHRLRDTLSQISPTSSSSHHTVHATRGWLMQGIKRTGIVLVSSNDQIIPAFVGKGNYNITASIALVKCEQTRLLMYPPRQIRSGLTSSTSLTQLGSSLMGCFFPLVKHSELLSHWGYNHTIVKSGIRKLQRYQSNQIHCHLGGGGAFERTAAGVMAPDTAALSSVHPGPCLPSWCLMSKQAHQLLDSCCRRLSLTQVLNFPDSPAASRCQSCSAGELCQVNI